MFGYTDVMTDLETLGTAPGCKLLSIGAAVFSRDGVTDKFYVKIRRSGQAALTESQDTLTWWAAQSEEARNEALGDSPDRMPLPVALMTFAGWLRDVAGAGRVRIWGNGADFDQPILAAAYREYGLEIPWEFYNSRCYRTLRAVVPQVEYNRIGTAHNALDDAVSQAQHAASILAYLESMLEIKQVEEN